MGVPIWARVTGIIAIVLIGVVLGSTLLGRVTTAGHGGGQHGQMGQMGRTDHGSGAQVTSSASAAANAQTPRPSDQHAPAATADAGRGH
jgi:hypothetical protein